MPKPLQTILGVFLAGALFVGGCRAPAPPPPPPTRLSPSATKTDRPVISFKVVEQAFEPAHLSLKANVTVALSVINTTSQDHNLTVKDPEGHRVIDVKIPRGDTIEVPFAPTTRGTYIFYCKHALHRTFGEEGTLEVH